MNMAGQGGCLPGCAHDDLACQVFRDECVLAAGLEYRGVGLVLLRSSQSTALRQRPHRRRPRGLQAVRLNFSRRLVAGSLTCSCLNFVRDMSKRATSGPVTFVGGSASDFLGIFAHLEPKEVGIRISISENRIVVAIT